MSSDSGAQKLLESDESLKEYLMRLKLEKRQGNPVRSRQIQAREELDTLVQTYLEDYVYPNTERLRDTVKLIKALFNYDYEQLQGVNTLTWTKLEEICLLIWLSILNDIFLACVSSQFYTMYVRLSFICANVITAWKIVNVSDRNRNLLLTTRYRTLVTCTIELVGIFALFLFSDYV